MNEGEVRFSPESYAQAGSAMMRAGQDVQAKTQALLWQVNDLNVLGTNDTLGGVAQMIYGVFLEVFQETVEDLATRMGEQGEQLQTVGQAYAEVETENTGLASRITGGA